MIEKTKDAVEILHKRYITDDARKQSVEHEREIASQDAEIARLKGEVEKWKKAENELSDAYLRIRALVRSWNTKTGGTDRYLLTEEAIIKIQTDLAAAKAEVERLRANEEKYQELVIKHDSIIVKLRKDIAAANKVIEEVQVLARDDSFNAWQQMHKIRQLLPEARAKE